MAGQLIKNSIDYHKATSYDRYNLTGHTLDWHHQPALYKTYPSLKTIPLPLVKQFPSISFDACVKNSASGDAVLDLPALSSVLVLADGITSEKVYQGQPFYYRSAASAGALYPAEIYLAAYSMPELDKGLYHYSLRDFSLHVLREKESGIMPVGSPAAPNGLHPAATFYISGIFFRSSWKYRSRAYRYVLLDAGHVLENLMLALISHGFLFSIHYDFNDERINTFLGLDGLREGAFACVTVYHTHENPLSVDTQTGVIKSLDQAVINASNVSQKEVAYDEIVQIHKAGIKKKPVDSTSYIYPDDMANSNLEWVRVNPPQPPVAKLNYAESVMNRRSRRNFIRQTLSRDAFTTILSHIRLSLSYAPEYVSCITTGFLAGNIEKVDPGFYMLDSLAQKTALVKEGSFIKPMASVCLDQQWLENAAVHFLFMADIEKLEAIAGPRGYRHAMLTAGRVGQHIYLASESLGIGCCGIGALYDNEAKELLGLEGERALFYLVAAGHVKKRYE